MFTFSFAGKTRFCLAVNLPQRRSCLVLSPGGPPPVSPGYRCQSHLEIKSKNNFFAAFGTHRRIGSDRLELGQRAERSGGQAGKWRRAGGGNPLGNTLRCARAGAGARAPPGSGTPLLPKHAGKWCSEIKKKDKHKGIVYYSMANGNSFKKFSENSAIVEYNSTIVDSATIGFSICSVDVSTQRLLYEL